MNFICMKKLVITIIFKFYYIYDFFLQCIFFFFKVCLILGISGGLRREELYDLNLNSIHFVPDNILLVKIYKNKSNHSKSFVVEGVLCEYIKAYIASRSEECVLPHLFMNYQ